MSERYIGLMSGTSMDALDAVLVELESGSPKLLASLSSPLPDSLRHQLFALTVPGDNEVQRSAQADIALGRFSAQLVAQLLAEAGLEAAHIRAIGSHGQTIRHAPDASPPYTVQIGDGNTLAQLTGITTICDFRRRDMVVGGQGAPLVPAFHSALYRNHDINRVIVNIGGMANITILPADASQPVLGFDTGPGNVLMDSWCQRQRNEAYDHNGRWAASGSPDSPLLERLLADPYFQRPPPKSTGREYFNLAWLEQRLTAEGKAQDIQATLCELTARSISQAILAHSPEVGEVIICGGGACNLHLMQRLAANLPDIDLHSSADTGIDPRWMEGMAFAWLAQQTIKGFPGNLPAVTGAREAVILGAIYPGG